MAKGRRGGGFGGGLGGTLKNAAWMFVVACIAVAYFGGAFKDPQHFYQRLKAQSQELEQTVRGWLDSSGVGDVGDVSMPTMPGIGGPDGAGGSSGSSATASAALATLTVKPATSVAYDRGQWRHWDSITACWNVREEVLYRDAVAGSVTLLDKDKHLTKDKSKGCYVSGGTWKDPYTGSTFTNPADLDIDHMVPLGEAARSGGQAWSSSKKQDYANNLSNRTHLIAVSASANRSKSDQTPATWKPANKAYWCSYATSWITVKKNRSLTITSAEKSALSSMLSTC